MVPCSSFIDNQSVYRPIQVFTQDFVHTNITPSLNFYNHVYDHLLHTITERIVVNVVLLSEYFLNRVGNIFFTEKSRVSYVHE